MSDEVAVPGVEVAEVFDGADDTRGPDVPFARYPAKLLREWVRGALGVNAIKRLYGIGTGAVQFEQAVPTAKGVVTLVRVEAPPGVQVEALKAIVALGIPRQLGVVDGDDNELPGVVVLGEMELDEVRRSVHGERYMPAPGALPAGAPLPPMDERVAAGEFEYVEIEEAPEQAREQDDHAPGELPPAAPTLEQQILARRRMRRAVNGNGGAHGARD